MNSRQENEMIEQNSAVELSDEMLVKVIGGCSEHRGDDGHGGRGGRGGRGWGRGHDHDRGHGHGGDRHHRGHHGLWGGHI